MADELYTQGKVDAMSTGIINGIGAMKLFDAGGAAITNSATGLTSTDFSVSATGQLSNATVISFTIDAADIGTTVTYVVLQNAAQTLNKIRLDLETAVPLTTAGTASFAIGALTADL